VYYGAWQPESDERQIPMNWETPQCDVSTLLCEWIHPAFCSGLRIEKAKTKNISRYIAFFLYLCMIYAPQNVSLPKFINRT